MPVTRHQTSLAFIWELFVALKPYITLFPPCSKQNSKCICAHITSFTLRQFLHLGLHMSFTKSMKRTCRLCTVISFFSRNKGFSLGIMKKQAITWKIVILLITTNQFNCFNSMCIQRCQIAFCHIMHLTYRKFHLPGWGGYFKVFFRFPTCGLAAQNRADLLQSSKEA